MKERRWHYVPVAEGNFRHEGSPKDLQVVQGDGGGGRKVTGSCGLKEERSKAL